METKQRRVQRATGLKYTACLRKVAEINFIARRDGIAWEEAAIKVLGVAVPAIWRSADGV